MLLRIALTLLVCVASLSCATHVHGEVVRPNKCGSHVECWNLALETLERTRAELDSRLGALVPRGTIIAYAGADLPQGFVEADGSLVDPLGRPYLHDLCIVLGPRFLQRDDPVGSCRLPDLRGRVMLGSNRDASELARRNLGEKLGEEKHQLTVNEMPAHAHSYDQESGLVPIYDGVPLNFAGSNHPIAKDHHATVASSQSGGDQPHSIMPPSLVVRFLIRY